MLMSIRGLLLPEGNWRDNGSGEEGLGWILGGVEREETEAGMYSMRKEFAFKKNREREKRMIRRIQYHH